MSEEGVEAVRTGRGVRERVDKTLDRLGGMAPPFQPGHAAALADLEATKGRALCADLNLRLQYGEAPLNFWRVGVRSIGDRETLTLQKSLRLGPRAWGEVGLLESKAGVGLNYQMTPEPAGQLQAYNPGDIQLDLRGIYQVSPEWYLTVGLADSLDDKLPFVGLRRWINLKPEPKDEE